MESRDVATEFVKHQVTLAYRWLLEHRAALKYHLRISEDERRFCLVFPPYGEGSAQEFTAEELADLVVEDQIGGASPWQGN